MIIQSYSLLKSQKFSGLVSYVQSFLIVHFHCSDSLNWIVNVKSQIWCFLQFYKLLDEKHFQFFSYFCLRKNWKHIYKTCFELPSCHSSVNYEFYSIKMVWSIFIDHAKSEEWIKTKIMQIAVKSNEERHMLYHHSSVSFIFSTKQSEKC